MADTGWLRRRYVCIHFLWLSVIMRGAMNINRTFATSLTESAANVERTSWTKSNSQNILRNWCCCGFYYLGFWFHLTPDINLGSCYIEKNRRHYESSILTSWVLEIIFRRFVTFRVDQMERWIRWESAFGGRYFKHTNNLNITKQ